MLGSPVYAQSDSTTDQTATLNKLLSVYLDKAKEEAIKEGEKNPNPVFSTEAGRAVFTKRRTWSQKNFTCANCHTDDPENVGKHIETKQPIQPLAPSANAKRFTIAEKVERNFTVHCKDLFDRDCYAQEKGDFLTYLMSVK